MHVGTVRHQECAKDVAVAIILEEKHVQILVMYLWVCPHVCEPISCPLHFLGIFLYYISGIMLLSVLCFCWVFARHPTYRKTMQLPMVTTQHAGNSKVQIVYIVIRLSLYYI